MSFTIKVDNAAVLAAFNRLIHAGEDLSPVMRPIGEDIVKRAKERFQTSTAPDGTPWVQNSDTTLRKMLHAKSDMRAAFSHTGTRKEGSAFVGFKKGYFKKDGSLTKKSQSLLAGKKPLIGESGDLARQIDPFYTANSVTVIANPVYAAIQQFGGKKSQFSHLWGDIPARPFLPVTSTGQLYQDEVHAIVAVINAHLQKAING
jgi:phage gpG-like protein